MTSRVLEVGVKIDVQSGIRLFGAEEVNALINEGWRVSSLQPGGVTFKRIDTGRGAINGTLAGFDIKVVLDRRS